MKNIYVIQLDRKRLFLVIGLTFMSFALILFTGIQIGKFQTTPESKTWSKVNQFDLFALDRDIKKNIKSKIPPSVKVQKGSLLSIPLEDRYLFEKKGVAEDKIIDKAKLKSNLGIVSKKSINKLDIQPDPFSKVSDWYSLQLAAFYKEQDAYRLLKKAQKEGINARVERGTRFWFVRAGKSRQKKSLQNVKDKAESMGITPFFVKEN